MMQKRMETLMQKLPAGTDAALIQSDVNRRYLTGMQSSAGTVLCFRDGAYLIIDFRYIEKARECVKNCTVLEQHDLYEQIRELLRKHNARTLSVESMTMTLSHFSKLKQQEYRRNPGKSRHHKPCPEPRHFPMPHSENRSRDRQDSKGTANRRDRLCGHL